MEGATVGQAVNFLMKMEGGGRIEEVAVMTTGTIIQEEVGGMTTAETTEMTTVTVMITAEMTTVEVVETVTGAVTENEAEAAIGLEAGMEG